MLLALTALLPAAECLHTTKLYCTAAMHFILFPVKDNNDNMHPMQKQESLTASRPYTTVADAIRQAFCLGRFGTYGESEVQLILFVLQSECKINPDERLTNCPRESLERALCEVLGTSAWKVLAKL